MLFQSLDGVLKTVLSIGGLEIHGEPIGVLKDFSKSLEVSITLVSKNLVPGVFQTTLGTQWKKSILNQNLKFKLASLLI